MPSLQGSSRGQYSRVRIHCKSDGNVRHGYSLDDHRVSPSYGHSQVHVCGSDFDDEYAARCIQCESYGFESADLQWDAGVDTWQSLRWKK